MQLSFDTLEEQFQYFPGTRYMGSKNKIIYDIWQRLEKIEFESVLDAFGGSNVVGYFLKCQGKKVITNIYEKKKTLAAILGRFSLALVFKSPK